MSKTYKKYPVNRMQNLSKKRFLRNFFLGIVRSIIDPFLIHKGIAICLYIFDFFGAYLSSAFTWTSKQICRSGVSLHTCVMNKTFLDLQLWFGYYCYNFALFLLHISISHFFSILNSTLALLNHRYYEFLGCFSGACFRNIWFNR